jgi:V/A-type H+-transporting ATPase subunit D
VTRSSPTRADRQRLAARLTLVERAVDLLRSKEEALDRERIRLRGHASRADARWRDEWSSAELAILRARSMGAGTELDRLAARETAPATVTPHWTSSMGVSYPATVDCRPGPAPRVTSTAALGPAVSASRRAVDAAAEQAAMSMAVRRLERELATTRRRRRALEERLGPSLRASIRTLDLQLDELDRDAALRARTVVDRRRGGTR